MEGILRGYAARGRLDVLAAVKSGQLPLADLYAANHRGREPAVGDARPLTMSVDEWLRGVTDPSYIRVMRRLLEYAGHDAPSSWLREPGNIRRFARTFRANGFAVGTERREMVGVGKLIAYLFGPALRTELMAGADLRRNPTRRDRWLTTPEFKAVRDASGEWWPVVCLALSTGIRRSELLRLKYEDVNLLGGSITIREGKSNAARRTIPLSGDVVAQLRGWAAAERLQAGERLFPGWGKHTVQRAWDVIRENANCRDVRWHDLRHTWAVYCAKAGMPLVELMHYGGWATLDQVQRYAEYSPSEQSTHLAVAVELMAGGVVNLPTLHAKEA